MNSQILTKMNDCCAHGNLIPHELAVAELLKIISPLTAKETIPISDALGRVLATDVISSVNVPPCNNSAMDGYAFAYESCGNPRPFEIVGTSLAGQPYQGDVALGQCVRIMTGAKMPLDCDTVQMQEKCQVNERLVNVEPPAKLRSNVRLAGEDVAKGSNVFAQGRELKVADIGVLASLGIAKVEVIRRAKVAIISTGDELTPVGEPLADGDIYESNGYVLEAYFRQCHCEVVNFGIIEDCPKAIEAAFLKADEVADVVISSGGVSVGDADYTKAVLDKIGRIAFWKVAIKPGKPFSCGQLPNSYFFGLPGNPVSALVTTDKIVLPALQKLQDNPGGQMAEQAPEPMLKPCLEMSDKIFLKDNQKCHLVSLAEMDYFESCKNYVRIFFGQQNAFIKKSLNNVEQRLPGRYFFRVNRQYIVNLNAVKTIGEAIGDGYIITMTDGKVLDISRRNASLLKERLSF